MKDRFVLFREHWRTLSLYAVCMLLAAALLGYKLGSLTGGLSSNELLTRMQYHYFGDILKDPLHAPYKIIGWLTELIPHTSQGMNRLPSALFALGSLPAVIYVMRRWYGPRMAFLGIILVITSAWFLHVGRVGTYEIEYYWAISTLVALHLLLHTYAERLSVLLLWIIGLSLLLFIPGMVWFVLLNVLLQRNDLLDAWDEQTGIVKRTILIIIPLIFLAALGLSIYRDMSLLHVWLGAPVSWANWIDMLKRVGIAWQYFILRGPHNPEYWLGRLPVLGAFASAMLIAGLIFYSRHLKAARTILLASFMVVGTLLWAIQPAFGFSTLVPVVYFIVVAGMAYLLHEWLRVFPRNPLARGLGIGIVGLLVIAACAYNLRSYYIAWPHNNETKQIFTQTITE